MDKIFHASVDYIEKQFSDYEADRMADMYSVAVAAKGGSISPGHNFGDVAAVLIMQLPEDSDVEPSSLVPEVTWTQARVMVVPAVADQGIDLGNGAGE